MQLQQGAWSSSPAYRRAGWSHPKTAEGKGQNLRGVITYCWDFHKLCDFRREKALYLLFL